MTHLSVHFRILIKTVSHMIGYPLKLKKVVNIMALESNIIINIYSFLILLVIYFHAIKLFDKESLQDKLFMCILYITALMLFMDILSRFDGYASPVYPVFNRIGNFVMFLMSPIIPSLWVAYVDFQIFQDEKRIKRLIFPLCAAVNTINAVCLIISQRNGMLYYIDSDNIYHRGPLFLLPVFITFALLLTAFVLIVLNRRKIGKKSFFSLVFLILFPTACILLQIKFYSVSIVLNGIVLSMLVVFLNIQSHSMYTDHLTGLNNRKKLDAYLEKKVSLSTVDKSFSAILIDINNFKKINNTFGHHIGDIALENTARLLKSCLRASDFIARFGGDEFCVILDISNTDELEAMIRRINSKLDDYNQSASSSYKLEFSMGYAVYDYGSGKSAVEFLEKIDLLMYKNKHELKVKTEKIKAQADTAP